MARPKITRWVPGGFTRLNTRRSELCLDWGTEDSGRKLWLREFLDDEDGITPESARGYLPLADLPAPPCIASLADLEAALRARFRAHPLANQLMVAVELTERALAASAPPLEVAKVAARTLCPGGVARALGAALEHAGSGAFRSSADPAEIKRVARACLILELGSLGCHSSSGPSQGSEARALALVDSLPPYPAGKHASHDSGKHDDVVREYDRLLSGYLVEIARTLDRALSLSPDKLDAPLVVGQDFMLPDAVYTPEEGLAEIARALGARGSVGALDLAFALRALHGQPLSGVRATIAAVLAGRCPIPLPEGVEITTEALTEPKIVMQVLVSLLATDTDLAATITAEAQRHAEKEAAWQKRVEAFRKANPPAPPSLGRRVSSWLVRRGPWIVGTPVAIVALVFMILRGCR